MRDEYSFLRSQYEEIVEHCEYLLSHSIDPSIRNKAKDSKVKAQAALARLDRQVAATELALVTQ
jgi:hypothetical protein